MTSAEFRDLGTGLELDTGARLSEIGGFAVVTRPTLKPFLATEKSAHEVANDLAIQALVSAELRRQEGEIQFAVELWSAAPQPLWSRVYTGQSLDFREVAQSIVRAVASAMDVPITEDEKHRIGRHATSDTTAYERYLRGLAHLDRPGRRDNLKAGKLLRKAIDLDPEFAEAHAALAESYYLRAKRFDRKRPRFDIALDSAERAVILNPSTARGHRMLGLVHLARNRQREALVHFRDALAVSPSDATSLRQTALILGHLGRMAESLHWAYRDVLLNPTSAYKHTYLGFTYVDLGDDELGGRWLSKALELDPDSSFAHLALVVQALSNRRYDEARALATSLCSRHPDAGDGHQLRAAIEHSAGDLDLAGHYYSEALDRNRSLAGDSDWKLAQAQLLFRQGRLAQAMEIIAPIRAASLSAIESGSDRIGPRLTLGYSHAVVEDRDPAIRWLREAIDAGWRYHRWARVDPLWGDLWDDPRFERLMDQVQADLERQRKAAPKFEPD